MLMQLLQLVVEDSVLSYDAIASQLDVSTGLLEQMMQDLEQMGYLAPVDGACDTSKCHHCPLGGSCATDMKGNVWTLTARGAQAARKPVGTKPSSII